MAEIRRGGEIGDGGGGGQRPAFGERLPWLEPVEDEDRDDYEPEPGGYGGVVLAAIAVLLLIALATAAILWFRHAGTVADTGQIIRAEPGPYKVKPQDPGGMKPDMTERVAAATNAGRDIDAPLDMGAIPEQSIVTRKPQAPGQPASGKAGAGGGVPAPAAPPAPLQAAEAPRASEPPRVEAPPAPQAPAGAGGGQVQLGAFSSEAKAKAAWKGLSSRFDFLKEMTPVTSPVEAGGTTLYRLRATGGAEPAGKLCGRLRIAGESCAVVGG